MTIRSSSATEKKLLDYAHKAEQLFNPIPSFGEETDFIIFQHLFLHQLLLVRCFLGLKLKRPEEEETVLKLEIKANGTLLYGSPTNNKISE